MPKVLVLYHSFYGHVEAMAQAVPTAPLKCPQHRELGMARYQGRHVAAIAGKLFG
jgi:hypothetical protein